MSSKEFYIRLTLGVYKVSQLFPKKEPLKADIRELADEILASLLCDSHQEHPQGCSENIELIQNLFNLAESRGLADPRNFSVLRREYARIGDFCAEKVEKVGKTVPARIATPARQPNGSHGGGQSVAGGENSSRNGKNKNRQEVILGILKNNGKVKMSDLIKSFPDINRRTILRDLGVFCQSGMVERNGGGRGACYTIKNATL